MIYRKYWPILRKYKRSLFLSPLLVAVTVLCETVQPYLMSIIVDDGVMNSDLAVVSRTGIFMVVISLVGLTVAIVNAAVSSKTSIGFGTDVRSELFKDIQAYSFPDIDKFSTSSLITRLTNDITKIQQVILMSMRVMLRAPMMMVMSVFFVITIDTQLALVLVGAIPLLGFFIFVILKKGFPFFLKVQQRIDSLNAVVRENLTNITVVKSFVREDFETDKFVESSEDLRDIVIRASNILVLLFPIMQLILNVSVIAVLWFGGRKVVGGNLQVGELISIVKYLMLVLMSLMMLSMVVMTFARASASSERILEVLNTEPSLTDTPQGLSEGHRIVRGEVEFRGVSFRYEDGDSEALKGVSFRTVPGETLAVAGATGSAKSTLVQLIPRLYDATEGVVAVDGVDVRDYPLEELHEKIGMVLQKNVLFSGTILENLRWGDPGASEEEVVEMAKAAEAHDFIMSFPEGYRTVLGRGGVNVSGGQKQRLCIARALLRRPKILILDDSTSAVDTETEQKIRRNLAEILEGTTVIIVTQRVNTMQSSDRILLMDDGQVAALGAPAELAESSVLYREIIQSQQNNS